MNVWYLRSDVKNPRAKSSPDGFRNLRSLVIHVHLIGIGSRHSDGNSDLKRSQIGERSFTDFDVSLIYQLPNKRLQIFVRDRPQIARGLIPSAWTFFPQVNVNVDWPVTLFTLLLLLDTCTFFSRTREYVQILWSEVAGKACFLFFLSQPTVVSNRESLRSKYITSCPEVFCFLLLHVAKYLFSPATSICTYNTRPVIQLSYLHTIRDHSPPIAQASTRG